MMERILFKFPNDGEAFLAALAAVQDYCAQQEKAIKQHKLKEWELCVQCPEQYRFLLAALPAHALFDGEVQRGDFDYVHEFDPELAYKISLPTEKHMAQVFGIQIGSDPKVLPDLRCLMPVRVREPVDVLFGQFPDCEGIRDRLAVKACEFRYLAGVPENEYYSQVWFDRISACNMFVGLRGECSYLAASMGKLVVELYPDDCHKRWLSKWSSKRYQMLYGKEFPVDKIWAAMEQLWVRFPVSPFGGEIPTVPSTSTAANVVGQ